MLYMVIAALLLVNMLIAMMGSTYQIIAERKNEWMRQVCQAKDMFLKLHELRLVCRGSVGQGDRAS